MYGTASRCLVEAKSEPAPSLRKKNAYNICANKFLKILDNRSDKDKIDRPFLDFQDDIYLSI